MTDPRPAAASGGTPLACPRCGEPVDRRNPTRPFCSPRCKWVDLGRWFEERYSVPGEAAIDMEGLDALGEGLGGGDEDEPGR